jgi:hypothetical protein
MQREISAFLQCVSQSCPRSRPGNRCAIEVLATLFCGRLAFENVANPGAVQPSPWRPSARHGQDKAKKSQPKSSSSGHTRERRAVMIGETRSPKSSNLVRGHERSRRCRGPLALLSNLPRILPRISLLRHAGILPTSVLPTSVLPTRQGTGLAQARRALARALVKARVKQHSGRPGGSARKPLRVKGLGDRLAYPWVRSVPPSTFVAPSTTL